MTFCLMSNETHWFDGRIPKIVLAARVIYDRWLENDMFGKPGDEMFERADRLAFGCVADLIEADVPQIELFRSVPPRQKRYELARSIVQSVATHLPIELRRHERKTFKDFAVQKKFLCNVRTPALFNIAQTAVVQTRYAGK
jgi:hypothetical protein